MALVSLVFLLQTERNEPEVEECLRRRDMRVVSVVEDSIRIDDPAKIDVLKAAMDSVCESRSIETPVAHSSYVQGIPLELWPRLIELSHEG